MHKRVQHVSQRNNIGRLATALAFWSGGLLAACTSAEQPSNSSNVTSPATSEPVSLIAYSVQQATVGVAFAYDASRGSAAFRVLRAKSLTYRISFAPNANGLVAIGARISGEPLVAGTFSATITASDVTGRNATDVLTIVVGGATPVTLASANAAQGATVGATFNYDATKGGTAFTGASLTYAVTFVPSANGFSSVSGRILGVPSAVGTTTATVTATDGNGQRVANAFPIVTFAADLVSPSLPVTSFAYSDISSPLPLHFAAANAPGGSAVALDNTPAANRTTDAGATLGRVLFYDRRVSLNDRLSCASCHQQQFAFADTVKLSRGFAGGSTGRHSMGLQNARFYQRGRFFWDERTASLEAQVLAPIQDATEMGMTLDNLVIKLSLQPFYVPLFQAAFGSSDITTDRIARALSQFVRSLVSGTSRFDQAFAGGVPNFNAVFTAQEIQGQQLFTGQAGCARCHASNAHVSDDIHNTGLDATVTDNGAGQGRFKAPSLRNIAVRAPYMHDGRFATLDQVVEFYNSGVQANPNLDNRLRGPNGQAQRLNLSITEKAAIVSYLRALTDTQFLTSAKYASPFAR